MSSKEEGLVYKYEVTRTDGKPISKNCFVLASTDPIAHKALYHYMVHAKIEGYDALANDLDTLLDQWEEDLK